MARPGKGGDGGTAGSGRLERRQRREWWHERWPGRREAERRILREEPAASANPHVTTRKSVTVATTTATVLPDPMGTCPSGCDGFAGQEKGHGYMVRARSVS